MKNILIQARLLSGNYINLFTLILLTIIINRVNKLLTQCLNNMGPNEINPIACASIVNCDINDSPTLADFLSISLSPSFAATPTNQVSQVSTTKSDNNDVNMTITNAINALPPVGPIENENETSAVTPTKLSLDNKASLSSAGCNRHFIITVLEKVPIIILNHYQ